MREIDRIHCFSADTAVSIGLIPAITLEQLSKEIFNRQMLREYSIENKDYENIRPIIAEDGTELYRFTQDFLSERLDYLSRDEISAAIEKLVQINVISVWQPKDKSSLWIGIR